MIESTLIINVPYVPSQPILHVTRDGVVTARAADGTMVQLDVTPAEGHALACAPEGHIGLRYAFEWAVSILARKVKHVP